MMSHVKLLFIYFFILCIVTDFHRLILCIKFTVLLCIYVFLRRVRVSQLVKLFFARGTDETIDAV